MSTLGFRSLVLGVIASTLAVSTALLGWMAYATVYEQILLGFDRKLLGISGTVGALTDGDGHAAYQQPHVITRFAPGAAGSAWAWDGGRSMLVRIDLASAAVVEYRAWPEAPDALVWLDAGERVLVQRADGVLVDVAQPSIELVAGGNGRWLSDGEQLYRWDGGRLQPHAPPPSSLIPASEPAEGGDPAAPTEPAATAPAIDPATPIVPPEPVDLLARDRVLGHWVGWNAAAGRLVAFDDAGRLLKAADLELGERPLAGLAAENDQVYLAADALLRYDWAAQALIEDFSPGYYDEAHPFVARHAPLYRALRERAGLTFLYTEVFLGDDQIRYVLDGSVGDDHSPPGYLDSVPEEDVDAVVRAQIEGTPFVSGIREWDAWGLVKVSAAPILDQQGEVVALAGADVDIGVIRSKTRNALFAVLGVGALLLLLSGLVSLWVAQSITRPLRDIKNAALRIAAGQYGARLESGASDEIGRLAGSLDRLSLRLREQAEASSASQSALVTGRLDEALRATLQPDTEHPTRLRLANANGQMLVLSSAQTDEDEAERAVRTGKLRVLGQRMLASGQFAADDLLRAAPGVDLVLYWRPHERRLCWSGRGRDLFAVGADGQRSRLSQGESPIAEDAQVCLDDGEVVVERGSRA